MRKGVRLYSKLSGTAGFGSLAMLDEDGVVVAWYEGAATRPFGASPMLNDHISQLYVPGDIALGIPARDLCSAIDHQSSTQSGWRRGPNGGTFWATTVIETIRLRDGRLQGFSHVLRPTSAFRERQLAVQRWSAIWLGAVKANARAALNRKKARCATFDGRGSAGLLMCVALMGLVAAQVGARENPEGHPAPSHSVANLYGSGWECGRGYRRLNEACAKISLPPHSYLDASGNRWRCDRGFLSVNDACAAITIPANAYLDDSFGTGWRCARGFRESRGTCVAVQIPAHAYAVDSLFGSGWECERGYVLDGGACDAVVVPANAYLTTLGDGWKCDRGFAKSANACLPINPPVNAHVDMQGNGWVCERGFQKAGSACAEIKVPANAHLEYSGGAWRCNRGFVEEAGTCVTD